jgi:large subunit ribosomal protein L19
MTDRIQLAEKPYLRRDIPDLRPGDTVEVDLKVKEGDKERVQTFTGTVIAVRGGGTGKTFTVRRIVMGEGVERIFPWHSPGLVAVRVTRRGKVRRAKLYYMRQRVGKATRLVEVVGGAEEAAAGVERPAEADGAPRAAAAKAGGKPAKGAARVEAPAPK